MGDKQQPIMPKRSDVTLTGRRFLQAGAVVAIHAGPVEIPDCSDQPLTMTVRAPGYEEAWFYDVALKPNETWKQVWPLSDSHGWYDFTVEIAQEATFARRLAGHVENGKDSISDPALGAQ